MQQEKPIKNTSTYIHVYIHTTGRDYHGVVATPVEGTDRNEHEIYEVTQFHHVCKRQGIKLIL